MLVRSPIVDACRLFSFTIDMSLQDLLQKDVKQVVGPNIRLVISSLPAEYSVEVMRSFSCVHLLVGLIC